MSLEQSLFSVRTLFWDYAMEIRNAEFSRVEKIFRKIEDKYLLETHLWDVLFRLEAGTYHRDNVIDLVNNTLEKLKTFSINLDDFTSNVSKSGTYKITIQNNEIIFELIAFLVSLRSMLDPLTKCISSYLKGKKFYSISDLNKYLEKEYLQKGTPLPFNIFTVIYQHWIDWVKNLRDYRDDLVHKLTISSSAEYEAVVTPIIQNGKETSKKIEILTNFYIPKNPIFNFIFEGLDQETPFGKTTSISEIKNEDGKIMYRDFSLEKKIDESQMIEIKSFVNFYYEKALFFVTQIITSLRKINFTYLTLE